MSADRSEVEKSHIRTAIADSWKRSQSNGVDATRLEIAKADADVDSRFVAAGAPVLSSMTDLLHRTSTSLALADPSGVITWRWEADMSITRMLARSEFDVGAEFAETRSGTNGIGLAIARREPVRVVGGEHFKHDWQMWACFAAPVTHPITGEVAGLVNVACLATDANHFLAVALRSLAGGITEALRAQSSPRSHRLLDSCVRLRALTDRPVVGIDRDVMLVDGRSRGLGLDHESLWSSVVDAGWSASRVSLGSQLTADLYPVARRSLADGVVLVLGFSAAKITDTTDRDGHGRAGGMLQEAERELIVSALRECRGNKSHAAQMLGISRGTLYQRLRQYKIVG